MPSEFRKSHRVAIVGASSLRGKELTQVLEDRHFPTDDVVLFDESVMAGTLTETAGEPTFIRALAEDSFEGARFVFFAGSPADAGRNWASAQKAGATVIDLTGALGTVSNLSGKQTGTAIPWIPALDSALLHPPAPVAGSLAQPGAYSSPSAPVIIVCTLAVGMAKLQAPRISVQLFPPVSERELAGIEELENQTTALLSFREIAKPIFDAQVAFSLLHNYGEAGKPSLAEMRSAVARDAAGYLSGRLAVPAVQLLQAPVFYGYAFCAYAEAASGAAPMTPIEQLEGAFARLGVKMDDSETGPTNISVVGESEIHVARIEPDLNVAHGLWIWGVADDLRLSTTNAVRIAEELLAQSSQ
jgi:aspartate-semialdehyde dehydrogenase